MLRTKNLCRHTFRDEDFSRPPKWQSGKRQVNTHARPHCVHPLVGVGYGNDTFLKVHTAEVEAEKGKGAVEDSGGHRTVFGEASDLD